MCEHEVVGDFHRGCQHFHPRYFTGNVKDCNSDTCKTSAAHKHKIPGCKCPAVVVENRKVQNMIQAPHSDCSSG